MSYAIPNTRWTFGGNMQYRGDIFAEGLQTYVLLTVDNLFDEKYYSGISVPYHGQVYGDPRKATLSLRKSF